MPCFRSGSINTLHSARAESMESSAAILIVEDNAAMAECVSFALKKAGWNPVTISTAADAWNLLQWKVPDLMVLDWGLPAQSGLNLLLRIRDDVSLKTLPVILLTENGDGAGGIEGVDRGADDCVAKPFSPGELTAKVDGLLMKTAIERKPPSIRLGAIELDLEKRSVTVDSRRIEIGNAEFMMLKVLMSRPECVLTRGQLIETIWGNQAAVDERTVDVHVLRLRKALKEKQHLIKTVRGIGYLLSAEG